MGREEGRKKKDMNTIANTHKQEGGGDGDDERRRQRSIQERRATDRQTEETDTQHVPSGGRGEDGEDGKPHAAIPQLRDEFVELSCD